MVNIVVSKSRLLKAIGISEEKMREVLPEIKAGIEAEEGDELTFEIRADRPDLLSLEGVSRAALGFIGKEKGLADLHLKKSNLVVKIDDSVKAVRPIIVCALAKGLRIDDETVKQIMQVQEKLTLTHGRRRKKVAIGIHDASAVAFPLVYKALAKNSPLEFIPLNKTKRMTLSQVMKEHEKGVEYAFALENASAYPVILDSSGDVISFPPIINAAKTTVTTKTRDLFLDVTGTDFEACNAGLNILCHDFADAGAEIFSIKTGERETPETQPKKMKLDCAKANKLLGLQLKESEIIECLQKQRLEAKGKETLDVLIPRYRTDFIHWIDLVEEIAIGYGYNKFQPKSPSVFTIGRMSKETEIEEALRDSLSSSGFVEQSTYVLTSSEKHENCVRIKNPVSTEYDALRSALLPKLLETLEKNTHVPYPQRLFEIGEVVVKHEGKALTQKRLSAITSHSQASLSEIAGALDNAVRALGKTMKLHSKKDSRFIEGRCASVSIDGKEVGSIGELHPTILEKIQVQMPCAAFEITV